MNIAKRLTTSGRQQESQPSLQRQIVTAKSEVISVSATEPTTSSDPSTSVSAKTEPSKTQKVRLEELELESVKTHMAIQHLITKFRLLSEDVERLKKDRTWRR